jgi:hypothetical protein
MKLSTQLSPGCFSFFFVPKHDDTYAHLKLKIFPPKQAQNI